MAEDFNVKGSVDFDASELDRAFEEAITQAFRGVEGLDRAVRELFRTMNSAGSRSKFGEGIADDSRRAARGIDNLGRTAREAGVVIRTSLDRGGRAAGEFARTASRAATVVTGDITDLGTRLTQLDSKFNELIVDSRRFGATEASLAPLRTGLKDLAVLQDRLSKETKKYGAVSDETLTAVRREYEAVAKSLTAQQKQLGAIETRRTNEQRSNNSRRLNNEINNQQALTNIVKEEGRLRVVEANRQAQLELRNAKTSGQQRLQVTRFFLESAGRAQKVFGDTLRQTLQLTRRLIPQVGISLSAGFDRAFRRGSSEVTAGGNRIERELKETFRTQERITQSSMTRQTRIIGQARAAQQAGLTGAASRSSILGGGIAIGGGYALARALKEGFAESVDLNESLNKTREIFGDASAAIELFADDAVANLFVTRSAALAAAADFGIFGKSANLTGPALAEFSTKLTTLATDIASFNNTSVEDAALSISAALRGESEPIRKYGVLLDAATLSARAFSEGITESVRQLTPQERVLAATAELFAQTKDAQGDAARTADDFANSSKRAAAAGKELFAAIAANLVPFAERITNLAFPALQRLTKVIQGDTSPAFKTLVTVLKGAATGIASLLVAKAAAEAIQLLAIASKALLTPWGAAIIAAGVLGGAIAFIAEKSDTFQDALDNLRSAFANLGRAGIALGRELLSRLEPILVRLANFLTNTVAPAVARAADFLAENLVNGFRAVESFVRGSIIPRLTQAYGLVDGFVREQLPKAIAVLRTVGEQVAATLTSVYNRIEPYTTTIVTLFTTTARSIRELFDGGSFGDVGGTLRAGLEGISAQFTPLLQDIATNITSFLDGVIQNIASLFSVGGVFNVIREAAFQVTNILTDPRLLGAILAAGVLIGSALLTGIAQGLINNISQAINLVGKLIGNEIIAGFLGVIAGSAGKLATVFVAVFAAQALFRKFGGDAGISFFSGFKSAAKGTPGFIQGLLTGGSGVGSTLTAKAGQAAVDQVRQLQRNNAALTSFGRQAITIQNGNLTAAVNQSNRAIEAIEAQVGRTRLAGARINTGLRSITSGFSTFGRDLAAVARTARSGGADVAGGVASGLTTGGGIRAAFGRLQSSVSEGIATIRKNGSTQAASAGQRIGVALGAAIGSALSGQILGSSGSGAGQALGLAGILSSALVVGSTAGPLAGAAVGALGLVSAAFTANSEAAKKAKEEAANYRDVLQRFVDLDPNDLEFDFGAELGLKFSEQLDKENRATIDAFAELTKQTGIGLDDLADEYANFLADGGTAESALSNLGKLSQYFAPIFDQIQAGLDEGGRLISQDVRDRLSPDALLKSILDGKSSGSGFTARFKADLQAAGFDTQAADLINEQFDFLNDEYAEAYIELGRLNAIRAASTGVPAPTLQTGASDASLSAASRRLAGQAASFGTVIIPVALQANIKAEGLLSTLKTNADELAGAFDAAAEAFRQLLNPDEGSAASAIRGTVRSIEGLAGTISTSDQSTAVGRIDVSGALADSKGEIARAFTEAAEDGLSKTDVRATLIPDLKASINEVLGNVDPDTAAELIRTIDLGLANYQPLIDAKLKTDGASLFADVADLFRSADIKLPANLDVSDVALSDALQGLALNRPKLFADLELESDPVARAQQIASALAAYQQEVSNTILPFTPDANFDSLNQAAKDAAGPSLSALASAIGATPLSFNPETSFTDLLDGVGATGTKAAIEFAARSNSQTVTFKPQLSYSSIVSQAATIASNFVTGFSTGINSFAQRAATAAANMAAGAAQAARKALNVQSPSKVMYAVGAFAAQGFTNGILDGFDELSSSLSEAIRRVVLKATGTVAGQKKVIGGGLADLFDSLSIGGAVLNGKNLRASTLGAEIAKLNALNNVFDSANANQDRINAIRQQQRAGEAISREDATFLQRAGTNAKSLKRGSFLGDQNLLAISDTVAAVQQFLREKLEGGASVAEVQSLAEANRAGLIDAFSTFFGEGQRNTITAFLADLGLGKQNIVDFGKQAKDLEAEAAAIRAEREAANQAQQEPDTRTVQTLGQVRDYNVNIYPQNLDVNEVGVIAGQRLIQRAQYLLSS